MDSSLSRLLAESVEIAWAYLYRSGEIRSWDAANFLTDAIERMIVHGHRNRMFLANKAIAKYQASRANVVPIKVQA